MNAPFPPLVLASTSTFRAELLTRLNVPFKIVKPQTDETPLKNETPAHLALRLSEEKARAVAKDFPNALIIGSDQVAFFENEIFGKPGDFAKAKMQLQSMRSKEITFISGLCLCNAKTGKVQVSSVITTVKMRAYSDEEIVAYLKKDAPYQCAGSAKSEALGVALMEKIESDDPTALVGLPLIMLCEMLRNEGLNVLFSAP